MTIKVRKSMSMFFGVQITFSTEKEKNYILNVMRLCNLQTSHKYTDYVGGDYLGTFTEKEIQPILHLLLEKTNVIE